ncbi:MAG: SGNH/GDSL hydrolase family protein [Gammaproteobacteria bacterium]
MRYPLKQKLTNNSLSRLGALALLCLWAASTSAAGLAPITQVILFGDSLSDTGNAFQATGGGLPPAPPYFNGRVSNGLVWVEPMASDLGVSITNYAVAGAKTGTGNVNEDDFPVLAGTGVQAQVGQFTADLGSEAADPGALYVVFGGANNFCQTCFIPGVDDPADFVNQGVTDILTAVGTLQATGAQKFLVFGLPDLGLTPRVNTNQILAAQLGLLTDAWNAALFGNLPNLGLGDNLRTIDTAQILRDVVADPGAFDLFNVTEACLFVGCNTQTINPLLDPDGFLFWDDIHPTRATHAILADAAYNSVLIPIPPAVLLFASAIGLLGWVKLGKT